MPSYRIEFDAVVVADSLEDAEALADKMAVDGKATASDMPGAAAVVSMDVGVVIPKRIPMAVVKAA